jgi:hypothetical protein
MKIRNKWNYKDTDKKERFNKPSLTMPDQTMSIPEILARYARGLPITQGKVPIYNGENDPFDGIPYEKLDLSERENIRKQNIDHLTELYEKVNNPKSEGDNDKNPAKESKPQEANKETSSD